IKVDTDFQEGNFTFQIVDIDDGNKPLVNKTVTLSGKNSAGTQLTWIIIIGTNTYSFNSNINLKTDENGIITLVNKGFYPGYTFGENVYSPAGDYTVTIAGTGNLKGSNTTNITINKIDLKISIEKFNEYYGTSKKFTIIVTNAKSGNPIYGVTVNFDVTKDGKDKITYQTTSDGKTTAITSSTTNSEGKIELPASNLVSGTYTIKGDVSNTTNYNAAKGSGDAIIKKIPTTINAKDVTVQYNTGATSTITVKDKNGKAVSGMYLLVRLYTTSSKYNDYLFQTNSKGQVSFSASLAVGKHKMIVTSADNRYEAKQVTKTITVKKASATIKAPKVTDYYKGVKSFAVKLVNSKNNKAIYDAKLNIKIFVSKNRYYNYKGNTGMNGQIKLLLDTLKPGSYKVVVSGADSKNFNAKQVTSKIVIKKAPAKLVPKKLTAKKGAKKYFQVTVKNKKTKKVITGVKIKVKVYTGKKAKTYTLKTNTKGIAKLNVNKLKVGTHKVVVTSANKYVTAKQAKSTIKIKR
ncbi:MAG: Ig-like domain-containing protein, partial [Methanobrevibacter sp.]|nr:Ig-like domain-containing protein [Methanobrevibacter sp.]